MNIVNIGLTFPRQRVHRTSTESIVLHHFASNATIQQVHSDHINRGWNGIGYNFVVHQDGTIYEGRGQDFQGAHTDPPSGTNARTIGIGCQGNFQEQQDMPDEQFNSLVNLVKWLRSVYGNITIRQHRELSPTSCPGQFFPIDEVRTLKLRGDNMVPEYLVRKYSYIDDNIPYGLKDELQEVVDLGLIGYSDTGFNPMLSADNIRMLVATKRGIKGGDNNG